MKQIQKRPTRKAIINISFVSVRPLEIAPIWLTRFFWKTGPPDQAVDAILSSALEMGIPVVSAAGNDEANACDYSPARHPDILTFRAHPSVRVTYLHRRSCWARHSKTQSFEPRPWLSSGYGVV
jgi:hypothetical protein